MKGNFIFCITLVLASLAFHNYPLGSLENKTVKVTSEMHGQSMRLSTYSSKELLSFRYGSWRCLLTSYLTMTVTCVCNGLL